MASRWTHCSPSVERSQPPIVTELGPSARLSRALTHKKNPATKARPFVHRGSIYSNGAELYFVLEDSQGSGNYIYPTIALRNEMEHRRLARLSGWTFLAAGGEITGVCPGYPLRWTVRGGLVVWAGVAANRSRAASSTAKESMSRTQGWSSSGSSGQSGRRQGAQGIGERRMR
jgi:hypothetical protein